MQSVFELAMKYYPTLWDKARLDTLLAAGKLTDEEYAKILEEKGE
jgi:hypothetical protein